jgi:hypothetical protein
MVFRKKISTKPIAAPYYIWGFPVDRRDLIYGISQKDFNKVERSSLLYMGFSGVAAARA